MDAFQQAIRGIPELSMEEEDRLARSYKSHDDIHSRNKIVEAHLKLVFGQVWKRWKARPDHSDYEDFVAAGRVGLLEAIKRFKPGTGVRFNSYARWWIDAEISDWIITRNVIHLGGATYARRVTFRFQRAQKHFRILNPLAMTDKEYRQVADYCDISVATIIAYVNTTYGMMSLHKMMRTSLEGEIPLSDVLADENAVDAEEMLMLQDEAKEKTRRLRVMRKALSRLDKRRRDIFVARRLKENPPTLEVLGEKHGITRERVRQLELDAFDMIKAYMLAASQSPIPGRSAVRGST